MIISRGVHPPEAMMHFPPVSDFPPFPKKFSDSVENFPIFLVIDPVAVLGFFVWGANGAGIFCLGGLMAIAEGKKRLPKKISDLCISPKNFIYLQKISDDLFFFFSHRLFLCFNLLFVSVTSRTKFWGGG